MTKYVFLVRPPDTVNIAALKHQVLEELVPRLLELAPDKLKVDLTEPKRPRLTVLPLAKNNLAMVSVWDSRADRCEEWQSEIASLGWNMAGYRVTESTPKACTKDWKDCQASPGIVMLTLMKKNPRLSHEQFMHEWFEYHTPKIALKVHPLWNYIRNVVDSVVVEGSQPLDGIVEEHCLKCDDITNPVRYFGGLFKMVPNMIKVGLHANKFLELSSVENYLLTEYHVRS